MAPRIREQTAQAELARARIHNAGPAIGGRMRVGRRQGSFLQAVVARRYPRHCLILLKNRSTWLRAR